MNVRYTASSAGHVLVLGAGMVGAACAYELSRQGFRVTVVEAGRPGGGATSACMGHVVVMDDSDAQFALCDLSRRLWDQLAEAFPPAVERRPCGTLWLAEDDEEMDAVRHKQRFYEARNVDVEVLDGPALRRAEPELRPDLPGALRVPGDSVVYPAVAVDWLLGQAMHFSSERGRSMDLHVGRAVESLNLDGQGVCARLTDGDRLHADRAVICCGLDSLDVLPEPLPSHRIRPRRGHLLITEGRPGFCRHQLVELGYLKSAHGDGPDDGVESVAFNLQPRVTGQLLLGSSRRLDCRDSSIDLHTIDRMVRRGRHFLPRLGRLRAIRMWTGVRPATDDHLPLIGPVPGLPPLLLAAGHEGLGITTSLATARLIAHHLNGERCAIDPTPYLPSREAAGHV